MLNECHRVKVVLLQDPSPSACFFSTECPAAIGMWSVLNTTGHPCYLPLPADTEGFPACAHQTAVRRVSFPDTLVFLYSSPSRLVETRFRDIECGRFPWAFRVWAQGSFTPLARDGLGQFCLGLQTLRQERSAGALRSCSCRLAIGVLFFAWTYY